MKMTRAGLVAFAIVMCGAIGSASAQGGVGPGEGDLVLRGAALGHSPRDADVEAEFRGDFVNSDTDPLVGGFGGYLEVEYLFSDPLSVGLRTQIQCWNSEFYDDADVSGSSIVYIDAVVRGRFPVGDGGTAFSLSLPIGITAFVPSEELADIGWDAGGGVNAGLFGGIEQVLIPGLGLFGEVGFHGNRFTTAYSGAITEFQEVDFVYYELMLVGQLGLFAYF